MYSEDAGHNHEDGFHGAVAFYRAWYWGAATRGLKAFGKIGFQAATGEFGGAEVGITSGTPGDSVSFGVLQGFQFGAPGAEWFGAFGVDVPVRDGVSMREPEMASQIAIVEVVESGLGAAFAALSGGNEYYFVGGIGGAVLNAGYAAYWVSRTYNESETKGE
jgi:hypothetical protein